MKGLKLSDAHKWIIVGIKKSVNKEEEGVQIIIVQKICNLLRQRKMEGKRNRKEPDISIQTLILQSEKL